MKTRKVADYCGYEIHATDLPIETVRTAEDGTVTREKGFAHIIPGLKESPDEPVLASPSECAAYIDEQLEWRSMRERGAPDRETFDTIIACRGSSLTVTVTKAARRLGLKEHSPVRVTIEKIDGTESKK